MVRETLTELVLNSISRVPDKIAVEEPGESAITYGELGALSDSLRDRLCGLGVRPGDRVGIYIAKSIDAVASILGVLEAGGAYVPVDPDAPAARDAYILNDCAVKAVVIEKRFVDSFCKEIGRLGPVPNLIVVDGHGGGKGLRAALEQREGVADTPAPTVIASPDDVAYILYTSGSTGNPKGVVISHRNATSFVNWCSEAFEPNENDRFSSHAPFHFDLSILDLYVTLKHGATVVLIPSDLGKEPLGLAAFISERRISIWYSTPSILSLLVQYGKLRLHDYSSLRTILFAGEVFPVKYLRLLKSQLPGRRYYNLYGPTETNVCTYYEVPDEIPADRVEPFPIGKPCSHYVGRIKLVDEEGRQVPPGGEGELVASGPGVMRGYWNLPERTASAFLREADGTRWYRTGDIVVEEPDGNYRYVSRRDRMVKRRGYRIELGEIETGLYRHPAVREAAVVALRDEESGVRIVAALSFKEESRPSIIELKRFCAENLPLYMVPDEFFVQEVLPKTSTDKIDYQGIKQNVSRVTA